MSRFLALLTVVAPLLLFVWLVQHNNAPELIGTLPILIIVSMLGYEDAKTYLDERSARKDN